MFSGCYVKHEKIKTYQAGDESLTCKELLSRIDTLEVKLSKMGKDKFIQKTGNLLGGPFFLYDLSEPGALDYLKRRLERLKQLYSKCR